MQMSTAVAIPYCNYPPPAMVCPTTQMRIATANSDCNTYPLCWVEMELATAMPSIAVAQIAGGSPILCHDCCCREQLASRALQRRVLHAWRKAAQNSCHVKLLTPAAQDLASHLCQDPTHMSIAVPMFCYIDPALCNDCCCREQMASRALQRRILHAWRKAAQHSCHVKLLTAAAQDLASHHCQKRIWARWYRATVLARGLALLAASREQHRTASAIVAWKAYTSEMR